jgi:hypothetical protein
MDEEMDLEQAHEFYKNPENLIPAGPARRPQRPAGKSGLVPVRFPQDMIAAVRRLAGQDDVTVSSWIRQVVAKEIKRRQPALTATAGDAPDLDIRLDGLPGTGATSATTQPKIMQLVTC